jgi:hypothetical protein
MLLTTGILAVSGCTSTTAGIKNNIQTITSIMTQTTTMQQVDDEEINY